MQQPLLPKLILLTIIGLPVAFMCLLACQLYRQANTSREPIANPPPPALIQAREDNLPHTAVSPGASQSQLELGERMARMQRLANNIFFAFQGENWAEADSYLAEMEKAIRWLLGKEWVVGSFHVGKMTATMLLPIIEKLKRASSVQDRAAFETQYRILIGYCSACHAMTGHPELVITKPRITKSVPP